MCLVAQNSDHSCDSLKCSQVFRNDSKIFWYFIHHLESPLPLFRTFRKIFVLSDCVLKRKKHSLKLKNINSTADPPQINHLFYFSRWLLVCFSPFFYLRNNNFWPIRFLRSIYRENYFIAISVTSIIIYISKTCKIEENPSEIVLYTPNKFQPGRGAVKQKHTNDVAWKLFYWCNLLVKLRAGVNNIFSPEKT